MVQRFQLLHNDGVYEKTSTQLGTWSAHTVYSSPFFQHVSPVHLFPKDPQYVKGLVLVNPATSYERSHWRIVGSLVANAPGPEAFGMAAVLTLATTIPDTAMVGASYNGNENTRLSVLVGDNGVALSSTGVALSSIKSFLSKHFSSNLCVLLLFARTVLSSSGAQFSKHLSELEALPPQELVAWFKSSTGEWLGRMLALFDKTPQVCILASNVGFMYLLSSQWCVQKNVETEGKGYVLMGTLCIGSRSWAASTSMAIDALAGRRE